MLTMPNGKKSALLSLYTNYLYKGTALQLNSVPGTEEAGAGGVACHYWNQVKITWKLF